MNIVGELPLAPVKRIIKQNAGGGRVGREATEALAELLEDRGAKIAVKAVDIASHADRKTVRPRDIELATK